MSEQVLKWESVNLVLWLIHFSIFLEMGPDQFAC